jgi:Protein of unknown function (DUF1236)
MADMQQMYQSTCRVRIWRLVPVRIDFGAGRRTAAYAEVAQLRNQPRTELMRKLLIVSAIFQFAISAAAAQSQIAASKVLSFEQEIRISQLITKQTEPLSGGSFSIALDALVPAEVQVHSLPPEAEQLAPQLRGFAYVVVEEQIALVDQKTRKIEIVFPRWGEQ